MSETTVQQRPPIVLDGIYYAASIMFTLYMFYYYWTGADGPVVLAMSMIPVTLSSLRCNRCARTTCIPRCP